MGVPTQSCEIENNDAHQILYLFFFSVNSFKGVTMEAVFIMSLVSFVGTE